MINSRQRAQLRSLANSLETIFQIGKSGMSEQIIKQADEALEAREIIKLRVLDSSPQSAREAAEQISSETGAEIVQVIGTRFVLYRQSSNKENIKIKLVK